MKILGHGRVINAFSSIKDLSRQINSKAISQSLRSPLQSLQHLRDPKKNNYSGFRISRMSINVADAQRKSSFGASKIVSNFWQKPSNVPGKKRDALIEKANDFLRRLDHVEGIVDRSFNATFSKLKTHSRDMRTEQQYEAEKIFNNINLNIESTRSKIQRILQENYLPHQHGASSNKIGLSEKKYDGKIKEIENLKEDFQANLRSEKNKLDNLNNL